MRHALSEDLQDEFGELIPSASLFREPWLFRDAIIHNLNDGNVLGMQDTVHNIEERHKPPRVSSGNDHASHPSIIRSADSVAIVRFQGRIGKQCVFSLELLERKPPLTIGANSLVTEEPSFRVSVAETEALQKKQRVTGFSSSRTSCCSRWN